jgi:LPXTG-motif cell wall-anchored protein
MNIFTTRFTRTRRGAAILFSGALVLGGLVLAGEATAGQEVEGNPTCSSLGYAYSSKFEGPGEGYYAVDRDGMEASVRVGTSFDVASPNPNNAIVGYSISTMSDGYAIVVKGGDGATVYRSGPSGLESTPLHAPAVSSGKWPTISHFQLCWNGAPSPGELEVTKVVEGTDTPDDHEFEICVSRIPGGDPRCETVVGEGTVTFEDLRPGDYVVTESDPGPMFTVEGSGATVTVESETTAATTVTNTWIPASNEFGRVEVAKVVTGDGAPTVDDTYEICLTGPDPSTAEICKTVVGQGTVSFERLVPGTYAVAETASDGDYIATITPTTVDVTVGGSATATVTNTYTEEESLPPTPPEVLPPEVLPPTVPDTPVTPEAPVTPETPATPAAPEAPADVAAQTALPATGSEGGIAAIAALLVATGVGLLLLGRRRQPQQA